MTNLTREDVDDMREIGDQYGIFTAEEWDARCNALDKLVDQIELDDDPDWSGDYNEDDISIAWGF